VVLEIVKHLLPSCTLVALLSASGPLGHAQPPVPAVDTATLGPQVGTVVPPISGVDQFGKTQSLATLSGPKGLMLVFSRSADW
jgi:hypothetical protein